MLSHKHTALVISCALLVQCGRIYAGEPETDEPRSYGDSTGNTGYISAPVLYKDLMLIAVSPDGVAAIVFGDATERGREYRFRYLPNDGPNEIMGAGDVFERYREGQYDGGKLTIRAGGITIGWSAGGDDRGWVYYEPEKVRLQIASAKRFDDSIAFDGVRHEKIDLKRFLIQP